MKHRLVITAVILLSAMFSVMAGKVYTVEDIPNVHQDDRTRFLSNPDGIISPVAQQQADIIMSQIWQETSSEVVSVVVEDIGEDTDPDIFATELFEKWGVGKKDKDNGLLLLVAINQRAAVIRTGYGMEGIVPDIVGGKILRHEHFPKFRESDYDGGIIAALTTLKEVITNPDVRDEIMSAYANDADASSDDSEEMWQAYLAFCISVGVILLVAVLWILISRRQPQEKYSSLAGMRLLTAVATPLCLFMPSVALLLLLWQMNRLRHRAPACPRCTSQMRLANADEDRQWLSDGQRTERRIKSVEHDVWVCPACAYGLVRSYPNPSSHYKDCPKCGAKTYRLESERVITPPTYYSSGIGVRVYRCENCGHSDSDRYRIPHKQRPVVIVGGGGHSGFGGGFGGGSFGGGLTGGGGASGRW